MYFNQSLINVILPIPPSEHRAKNQGIKTEPTVPRIIVSSPLTEFLILIKKMMLPLEHIKWFEQLKTKTDRYTGLPKTLNQRQFPVLVEVTSVDLVIGV